MTCRNTIFRSRGLLIALSALLGGIACTAHAQNLPANCGNLRPQDGFGPFDYRSEGYVPETIYRSHRALLFIVENAHFTAEVEALIRGKTSAPPGPDINYTLMRFPNHHRALLAMDKLSARVKLEQPFGARFTIECYFRRAVAWRPDDHIVRMLFAQHLIRHSRLPEASEQLAAVSASALDNPITQYNVGLLYFDMKDFKRALEQAHKAMALGLPRTELRDKLRSVNAWDDPIPETEQPAASKAQAQ